MASDEPTPAQADPGPAGLVPVPAAANPQFFLNPSRAMVGTLDFSRPEARKYYTRTTKKLDDDDPFDCTPSNMYHFLKLLNQRANESGWDDEISGILWIPEDLNDQNSEL